MPKKGKQAPSEKHQIIFEFSMDEDPLYLKNFKHPHFKRIRSLPDDGKMFILLPRRVIFKYCGQNTSLADIVSELSEFLDFYAICVVTRAEFIRRMKKEEIKKQSKKKKIDSYELDEIYHDYH